MLSRDAIKTCASLRYSGYSDSNSACISLGIKKTHTKKREKVAHKKTQKTKHKTHKKKQKKALSLVSRRHNFDTPHKKSGERSVFCVCEEQHKKSRVCCVCVGQRTTNDMALSSNGSPQSSIDPHAYCRLRFDEAAEEAIENLANVLQWHRNSQHEGMFVAQKDGRAGASRKLSSSSSSSSSSSLDFCLEIHYWNFGIAESHHRWFGRRRRLCAF